MISVASSLLVCEGLQDIHRVVETDLVPRRDPPNPTLQTTPRIIRPPDRLDPRDLDSSTKEDPKLCDPRPRVYHCRSPEVALQTYHRQP